MFVFVGCVAYVACVCVSRLLETLIAFLGSWSALSAIAPAAIDVLKRKERERSEVCFPAALLPLIHLHLYIIPMVTMGEKREDDDEKTPLQVPYPRGVRHNASGLAGLFLIFLAAITYGSYFYGIPGHAVKSEAEVILAENPLGTKLGEITIRLHQNANIICSMPCACLFC